MLVEGLKQAVELLATGNKDIYDVMFLSLRVSLTAVAIGAVLGIPLAAFLSLCRFPGRKLVLNLIFSLMGLPPVLAGLVVYLLLSQRGPLGYASLLWTPTAMIIAQVLLVIPIITGLSFVAIKGKEDILAETAVTLGATGTQTAFTVIREASAGIIAGILTGFGRVFAEVGAVMMVGGNIEHHTRVLTTAIILETRQGNFDAALALGIVLLVLSFIISSVLISFQKGVNRFV